jgi:hypothetical protein
MISTTRSARFPLLQWVSAVLCGAAGLFFTYYSIRLAIVWQTVRTTSRASGMYIGAAVFPVLACSLLFACRRLIRSARGGGSR